MNYEERLVALQNDCANVGYACDRMGGDPHASIAVINLTAVVKELIDIVVILIDRKYNEP